MIDELVVERYNLAKNRTFENTEIAVFFTKIDEILTMAWHDTLKDLEESQLMAYNQYFYQFVQEEEYQKRVLNTDYAVKTYGEEKGQLLSFLGAELMDCISFAYRSEVEEVLRRMELFNEIDSMARMDDGELDTNAVKEAIYYYKNDYLESDVWRNVSEMLDPAKSFFTDIVMHSDLSNDKYLYLYGEHITDNERIMRAHLQHMEEEEIAKMVRPFTEGFKKGFKLAGIDLTKKKSVNIRYPIGMERYVREAISQFRAMGLEPVIYCRTNRKRQGVESTLANKQYPYDHRFDDCLYLNHAWVKKECDLYRRAFEEHQKLAAEYAGPAVIETFGEELFSPINKANALKYTKKQEKLALELRRDRALILNEFIPRDAYSFTIIAFPLPEIGSRFEEIFDETVKVNMLDSSIYQKIQEKIIKALDQGECVHVSGRGENVTDLTIQLHTLENPQQQTNFENCLADVNIPLGEVFTSPQLTGTHGTLHVTSVYLNDLKYQNLKIHFTDGMIDKYSCTNYDEEDENKKYIRENLLLNRDTLPMGEFAIGTNTAAYQMGLDFGISHKLPILIGEKTGPHFAIGDTCYSMSEDLPAYNPDGKEIIARDNECSILRKTDMEKAYFNCHTDITIPYSQLGDIRVICEDGSEIEIIKQGRFVLPGTEKLNEAIKNESED